MLIRMVFTMLKSSKKNLKLKSQYFATLAIISIVIGILGIIVATGQPAITGLGYDYSRTIGTGFLGISFIVLGGFLLLASVLYDLKALEIADD